MAWPWRHGTQGEAKNQMSRKKIIAGLDSASVLIEQFGGQSTPCAGGEASGFIVYPTSQQELRRSQAICRTCPFRRECGNHAAEFEETGVWGGNYFCEGKVRKGKAPFLGKRGVRIQTEEEMFDPVYEEIPIDKLDDFNKRRWDPYYGYINDNEEADETAEVTEVDGIEHVDSVDADPEWQDQPENAPSAIDAEAGAEDVDASGDAEIEADNTSAEAVA